VEEKKSRKSGHLFRLNITQNVDTLLQDKEGGEGREDRRKEGEERESAYGKSRVKREGMIIGRKGRGGGRERAKNIRTGKRTDEWKDG
jgi:hypothetical protein